MNNVKDKIRNEFLRELDDADRVNLSEWEAKFVGDNAYTKFEEYTEKQREVIDKLRDKYERYL